MSFENTLQYVTFSDRTQVKNLNTNYDTLMATSHLLAGGKKAVTSLIHNLIESEGLEYYINPTVTEFQAGRNFRNPDGTIREWHSKLIDELGEPFTKLRSEWDNIQWGDLNPEQKQNAIESICDFQTNFVDKSVEDEMDKYSDALDDSYGFGGTDLSPRAVIPWYTQIEDYEDITDNGDIIERCMEYSDLPVKPCLHTTIDFISDVTARSTLADFISTIDVPETFIWIDSLDKNTDEVDARTYRNVTHLVASISDEGVDPHFLFGDFFSNILYYFGLRGTSYGTFFRESYAEKMERKAGGGMLQRYYYNPIKEFLSVPVSVSLGQISREPIPEYDGISDWDDLLREGEDYDFLKNHYIKTRESHKNQILNQDLSTIVEELEENHSRYEPILEGLEATNKNVIHLEKWVDGIELFEQDYEDMYENKITETQSLSASNW